MSTPRIAPLCLLLLAPVAAAAPDWAAAVGLDLWNLPSLHSEVEHQLAKERNLDAEDEGIRQRIEIKETLVAELIAGQATLAEVTEQFLALNRSHPYYMEALRGTYSGATDEETVARAVVGFVNARLPNLPREQREEVTARLDAELGRFVEAQRGHRVIRRSVGQAFLPAKAWQARMPAPPRTMRGGRSRLPAEEETNSRGSVGVALLSSSPTGGTARRAAPWFRRRPAGGDPTQRPCGARPEHGRRARRVDQEDRR